MDIKFVAATQTPELVKQVLGSANKFTNEYDLWITFTLCVTAIIIICLICLTIYLLRNRKEKDQYSIDCTAGERQRYNQPDQEYCWHNISQRCVEPFRLCIIAFFILFA